MLRTSCHRTGTHRVRSHTSAVAWAVAVTRYLPSGENAAAVAPPSGQANLCLALPVSQSSPTTGAGWRNEEGPSTASDLPSGLNTGAAEIESIPLASGATLPVARSNRTSLPFGVTTAAVRLSAAVAT